MKRIIPIYTTGIYRTPATIKGINMHATPDQLKDGHSWVYTDRDGIYSKLLWDLAPPPVSVAYQQGFNAAIRGDSEDSNSWLPGDRYDAWVEGYAAAKESKND